jgi:cytochrome P450
MVAHRTFETRDRSFEDRASKLPRSATQSPDTLPERMPAIDALPRAPSIPVLGSIPAYFRDPLAFFLEAGRRGSVVDLRFPTGRAFHIGDPADIEYVVVTSNKSLVKDATLRDLRRVLGDGLLTSEGEFWRRQRRLAQPAFHRDRLRTYAAQMVASTDLALRGFRQGEERDVHRDLMRLTLDIVTRTLFGSDIGDGATAMGDLMEATTERYESVLPLIFPAIDRLPIPRNLRLKNGLRRADAVIHRIIGERQRANGDSPRDDLLSMLLGARDEDGSRMTDAQVRDEVITMVLAGHETTANAVSWAFFLLSQNPAIDDRLGAELASVLGGRLPTLDDLPRLPYVEQVVQETLRLYPPAWAFGREVIEPFELRGIRFPAGAQLFFSQWVVHRDPRRFPDPEAFRPERWGNGFAKTLPRFAYFPFGGGPRACIGNAFALMEAAFILATMAQRFRFALAPGQRVKPQASITLRPRHGLRMRVAER